MPSYEYQCDRCGRRFAIVQRISEHGGRPPACPKCRSRRTHQRFTPFYAKTGKKS